VLAAGAALRAADFDGGAPDVVAGVLAVPAERL
jgi:hypothetical protein